MNEEILKDLEASDPARRRGAAETLAGGDERAIYPLIKALRDENPGVQDAAMRSLVAIGGEVTAYMVLPMLREDPFLRNAALLILKEIGSGVVPLLKTLYKDKDDDVRKFAVDLLCDVGRCDDPGIISAMIAHDPNPNVRAAAARAAGILGIRESLPQLRSALRDEEWVLFHALESIAALRDASCVEAVTPLLASPSDATRYAALECLGAIGSDRSGGALLAHLEHAEGHELFLTAKSLILAGVALPKEGLSGVLLEVVRHGDPADRLVALRGLAELREEGAVIPIIDAAGNFDPADPANEEFLQEVREALARFGRPGAVVRALTDVSVRFRGKVLAAEVAGRMGLAEAVPALVGLLGTDLRDVRRAAAEALGRIGGDRARQALAGLVEDRDGHVRKLAARALGRIKDRTSFDRLAARLKEEKYPDVVEEFALALLAIDREALLARIGEFGEPVRSLAAAYARRNG